MPSDFISLFGSDIDLRSPKSLYSKESVYDLLPKELRLPHCTDQNSTAMSQKSGGGMGSPPPAALASDSSSVISPMTMRSPSSAFPTSSSFAVHSSATEHDGSTPEDAGSHRKSEMLSTEGKPPKGSEEKGGEGSQQQHHHQMTPPKYPVLNISPPPEDLFDDSHVSGCQEESLHGDSEQSNSIWMENSLSNFSIMSSSSYNDNTEVPRKARKRTPRQRPGAKPKLADGASIDVFDADSAKGPHFVLSQLSPENKASCKVSSDGNQTSVQKGGILSGQYPQKGEGKELKILVQPESQHRARYLTEGSRGSVKDHTQQGFPTVKLEGIKEPVVLQVFVGNDTGRVKPHGFYQACRVTGRNTTACREVDIQGTTVIEVPLDPSNSMTLAVDCVGILKLRNADVEARIGVAGSKKKSTRARLVFRVNITRPDGSILTLQTPSSPILCTQPAGIPEILKKSLHSCSVQGGEELFIIGKNFLKGTKVIFQENVSDEKSWKAEAEIDMELFHQNHLIVTVPPYKNLVITSPVPVGIYVLTNAGRCHDVQPFTYTPEPVADVKKEAVLSVKPCTFEQKVIDSALVVPVLPFVKTEEVTPMEVSSNSATFKSCDHVNQTQQTSVACRPREQEQSQSSVFPNKETLNPNQKPESSSNTSFQQFLLNTDSLAQERSGSTSGTIVGISQMDDSPQHQLSLLPPDEVAQLEQAVRQLQAKGFCNIQLHSEDSLAKRRQHQLQQNQVQQQQMQQQHKIQQHQIQQQQQTQQQQIQQHQIQQQQQTEQQQIQQHQIQQQQQTQQQQIQQHQIQQQQQTQQQQIQQHQIQQQQQTQQQQIQQHQIQQQQQTQQQQIQQHQIQQQQLQQQQTQQQQMQQHQIQQQQQTQQQQMQQHQIQQQQLQQQQTQQQQIQQHQIQQQQQTQQQQIQQHQIQQQQLQQQLQQQQQHIQEQQQMQQQQMQQQQQIQQQQQVLENLQHQLFHPQVQMHCSSEQQGTTQSIVENSGALFQQQSSQQQQQQQAAMFQQAKDLISIQAGFLQQTSTHTSSPMFHASNSLAEAQTPQETHFHTQNTSPTQEHVQASLFQNPVNVLDGSNLTTESQHSAPNMFLPQNTLPGQFAANNNQSQQLAFLTSMQKSALEPQSVFQASTQLPPIQQGSPMEQQSTHQASQSQPGSLFQGISQSPITNLPANQHQSGLVFNSMGSGMAPEQPSSLLFSGQPQIPSLNSSSLISPEPQNPSVSFSQNNMITIRPEEPSEPMSFQDHSSAVNNQAASKQALFQEQQPMQLAPSSGPGSQPSVNLFIAQPDMSRSIVPQEVLFVAQNNVAGLQTTTSSPVQQPGSLFQTTITGGLNQPSQNHQPNIFLYEIQNECSQLMNSEGNTLSDQIIAISQSGQNQRESDGQMHSLLNPSMTESGNVQNALTTSQNMEKIDDLLVSLQEQGSTVSHSY